MHSKPMGRSSGRTDVGHKNSDSCAAYGLSHWVEDRRFRIKQTGPHLFQSAVCSARMHTVHP